MEDRERNNIERDDREVIEKGMIGEEMTEIIEKMIKR